MNDPKEYSETDASEHYTGPKADEEKIPNPAIGMAIPVPTAEESYDKEERDWYYSKEEVLKREKMFDMEGGYAEPLSPEEVSKINPQQEAVD